MSGPALHAKAGLDIGIKTIGLFSKGVFQIKTIWGIIDK